MTDYEKYWKDADETQEKVFEYLAEKVREISKEIYSITRSYKNFEDAVDPEYIHLILLDARDNEWYSNQQLQNNGRIWLTRRIIPPTTAFELELSVMMSKMYFQISRYVMDIYNQVALDYSQKQDIKFDIGDYTLLTKYPNGSSANTMMFVEAEHRVRRFSRTLVGLIDAKLFTGMNMPSIQKELKALQNALLAKSSKGGWHGILDQIMVFGIGYALSNAYDDRGYTFYGISDENQTDACRELKGRRFKSSEIQWGVNFPPIINPPHPCRSWVVFDKKSSS